MIQSETMSTPTFPSPPPDPDVAFAAAIEAFDAGSVRAADVRALSDMTRERWRTFHRAWPRWSLEVRRDVSREMGELGKAHVDLLFGRAFRVALDDEDPTVRQQAIAGLWEDTGADFRERLVQLAGSDPSRDVRAEAALGLGRFAERGAEGELDPAAIAEIRLALTSLAGEGAQPDDVRQRAIESLGVFGDPAVTDLIREAYASDDPALMTSAVAAMGRSRSAVWLDDVLQALGSDDTELRQAAARACGAVGDSRVIAELSEAALDPEKEVRIAALDALAAIGGKTARRVLETAATDEEYPNRAAAEAALTGMLDDPMLA